MMLNEYWKDVKDHDGIYEVSNIGKVRNKKTGRILKVGNKGYHTVCLSKNGKRKYFLVHRLVAEAFLPNPENLPIINHKSEKPWENWVELDEDGNVIDSNLEWCSYSYNNNYGTRNERLSETKRNIYSKGGNIPAQRVGCYSKEGKLIEIFDSIYDAARKYGYSPQNIWNVINNKIKKDGRGHGYCCQTAYGYKWRVV